MVTMTMAMTVVDAMMAAVGEEGLGGMVVSVGGMGVEAGVLLEVMVVVGSNIYKNRSVLMVELNRYTLTSG